MTLTATLATALTGLNVSQHALSVTANNIANVSTPGFSRKREQQETVILEGVGRGATIADTQRIVDRWLDAQARQLSVQAGRSGAIREVQERLQATVFGGPADAGSNLSGLLGRLSRALETAANSPDRSAPRLDIVNRALDLTARLASDSRSIQTIRRDVDQQIRETVAQINRDLAGLHAINTEVARSGGSPELFDRRDKLLRSLAENIDLTISEGSDGTISVTTRGGVELLGTEERALSYTAAATVGEQTVFGPIRITQSRFLDPATGEPMIGAPSEVLVTGGVRSILSPELLADSIPDDQQTIVSRLRGGRLQGLLEARDRILPEIQDQLNELADQLRYRLDGAHNAAVPHPLPGALAGSRTDLSGFAAATRSGTAYLAVVDRSNGTSLATIAIDLAAAVDETALAAQIQADLGALGTASIGSGGNLVISLADPTHGLALAEGDSRVVVADAAGHVRDYAFAHYFGLNDLLQRGPGGPTTLTVRADIVADPTLVSNVRLDVDLGPPLGSAAGGSGDRRGLQGLAAALDTPVETVTRGRLAASTVTLGDYAADVIAVAASAAASSIDLAESDSAMLGQLDARRSTVSGVNMDEELSRLILFQKAYTVSARIVSITNELFDELVRLGR
jgi:flagellar hook-associated protein 1 FlgK